MKTSYKVMVMAAVIGASCIAISVAQQDQAQTGQQTQVTLPEQQAAQPKDPSIRNATVKEVSGMVDIKKAGVENWVPAEKGMSLTMGDAVRTTLDSVVVFQFDDGGVVQLNEETEMQFEDLSENVEKARFLYFFDRDVNAKKTKFKMKQGEMWASVRPLPNTRSKFQIQTPRGIAGVRGTEVGVKTDNRGDVINAPVGGVEYTPMTFPVGEGAGSTAAAPQVAPTPAGPSVYVPEGASLSTNSRGATTGMEVVSQQQVDAQFQFTTQQAGSQYAITHSQESSNEYDQNVAVNPTSGTAVNAQAELLSETKAAISATPNEATQQTTRDVEGQLPPVDPHFHM